ncbi:alpha/beta fold hydrolase [Pilimelia terevasa]|uniref:alpha/beta fold hydrolase n=1 Tax=Pilimelia terevasa TaxID=53372 RepID=UPI001667201A|nr:alpha/beta fold hydrolase [Pilimelia terevasa]
MPQVDLTSGVVAYADTGGAGRPVLVLLGGLFVGGSMWRHVVAEWGGEFRCVVPQLPLGAHRTPMRSGADLSGRGIARLVGEFLERLDLRDVTLVGSDWGGAQLVVAEKVDGRVARLVLLPQEALDNYPPGLSGRSVCRAARTPGGLTLTLQQMRFRALRRSPLAFGRMSKRGVPDQVLDAWLDPALRRSEIRRDVARYLRSTVTGDYLRAAAALAIPEDQPAACAAAIRRFVRETPDARAPRP